MPRPRFLPLALLLPLFITAIIGADEIALTKAEIGPAALSQDGVAVASDGDGYLAVWNDGRSGVGMELRATRVTADGEVLDGTSMLLFDGTAFQASVTWTGTSYLVIWGTNVPQMWALRIDRDGTVIEPAHVLKDQAAPRSAAVRSGSRVAVAYRAGEDQAMHALILTSEGQPAADFRLFSNDFSPLQLAANNTHFVAVWLESLDNSFDPPMHVNALRFDASGVVDASPRVLVDAKGIRRPGLASNGSDFLLLAGDYSTERTYARSVRGDLSAVGEPIPLPGAARSSLVEAPAAVWTGSRYIVLAVFGGTLVAIPVDADGHPGETVTLETNVSSGFTLAPAATTNGRDIFVGWQAASDVFGTIASAADLHGRTRSLLARSAPRQIRPMAAAAGNQVLTVWSENETLYAKRLASNGTAVDDAPIEVTRFNNNVAVGANGADYVVAWFDSLARELVTRVVHHDGTLRADGGTRLPLFYAGSIAIADGLIAWSDGHQVNAARLGPDGDIVDRVPLLVTTASETDFDQVALSATGDGRFLIVWSQTKRLSPDGYFSLASIRAARVTSALVLLDPMGINIESGAPGITSPAVTWNGSEWLVVWRKERDMRGSRVSAGGTPLDPSVLIVRNALYPSVTWDGSRYALAWVDYVDYDQRTRTAWLTALGAAPFAVRDLGTAGSSGTSAALVPVGGNVAAIYSRVAREPQYGGVARAFASFLPQAPPRLRAVR